MSRSLTIVLLFLSVSPLIEFSQLLSADNGYLERTVFFFWRGGGNLSFYFLYSFVSSFPLPRFESENIGRLTTTWKSICCDAEISASMACVCHRIRPPLWSEQPRIGLGNHLIHTVCGLHPRELKEKEEDYPVISRASLEVWRFWQVWDRREDDSKTQ